MENDEKITKICISMNDIECLLYHISLKFDILNVYLLHKSVNTSIAHSALLVLQNLNPDYEKLEKLYSQTQKDVFEIFKNIS